jgi:hypothetical protein
LARSAASALLARLWVPVLRVQEQLVISRLRMLLRLVRSGRRQRHKQRRMQQPLDYQKLWGRQRLLRYPL